MKDAYNRERFFEVGAQLAVELNKMTVPELQEFKKEWVDAIQTTAPVAKNFCSQLVDVLISEKEKGE